jgi:hypothetical protein
MNNRLPRLIKATYQVIVFFLYTAAISQEIAPEITMEKKKLIILTGEEKDKEITAKIYQIASSTATQLNRYNVIDRSQLDRILKEQKLQYSGVVDQDQAIEIGKVAAANQALFIQVYNFGQKGVPTEKQKEKEEAKDPETGLFGWVVKEVVKAEINKEMENVERYPNNIHTVIDGEVRLINVETGESDASFSIHADHTGGVKAKSLSGALKQVRSQMYTNLKILYKLSSEILDVRGDDVTLLLGENMGLKPGTLFEIITREEKRFIRDREITIPGKSVGFVEVQTTSLDASEGRVLRKWDDIEMGYQAQEIAGGIFTGGISGMYGSGNSNMQLRFFGNFNPFHRFGWSAFGGIGLVKDSRDNSDFQFSLGFSLNYHLIQTSSFSIGPMLSVPFDFHMRMDDEDTKGVSHYVFLPVTSPRVGAQSEIMISSNIDLVIGFEYVVTSANLGNWTYTEEQENDSDESKTWNANWDDERGMPEIDYQGWVLNLGIRSIFF